MAGLLRSLMYGLTTGIQSGYMAMRSALYEDPLQRERRVTWADMASAYTLMWAYYDNSLFERDALTFSTWSAYKQQYGMYRNIRLIYNPVPRLVNFYVGQVYPGLLFPGDQVKSEEVPSAMPLPDSTPTELRTALTQFWQWSNWQARKSVEIRYGAALGAVLVEVVDDVEHGRVSMDIWKPGLVRDFELDTSGNVKFYALEYLVSEDNRTYTYRKEVDGEVFREYRDDQLTRTTPNPYGFVPAVWIKHFDIGSTRGGAAFTQYGKIDELNGLASHIHDQIHKVIGAPMVIWSSNPVTSLLSTQKRGSTDEAMVRASSEQEAILIMKGSSDGHVDSLAGNLPLAEAQLSVEGVLHEIERDHPELTVFEQLRTMSQITGPAAQRLVAPAISRLMEASANYDRGNIALFQMALAIGGMRANSGAWGSLDGQQQKFLPFNLDSYRRNDLDFSILPRPLLVPTNYENALEDQAEWTGVGQAVTAGVPLATILRKKGWTEEQLSELGQDTVNQIKRDQFLSQEDVIPPVTQQGRPNNANSRQ